MKRRVLLGIAIAISTAFPGGIGFIKESDYVFPSELVGEYSNQAIYPERRMVRILNSDIRFTLASFFKDYRDPERSIGFDDYQANLNWIMANEIFAWKPSLAVFATSHDFVTSLAREADTLPLNIRKTNYHLNLSSELYWNFGNFSLRFLRMFGLISPDLYDLNSVIKEGFTVGWNWRGILYSYADLEVGHYMPDFFVFPRGFNSYFKPSIHGRLNVSKNSNNINTSLVYLIPFDFRWEGYTSADFYQTENASGFFEWILGYEYNLPNFGNSIMFFIGSLIENSADSEPIDRMNEKKLGNPWIVGINLNIQFFGQLY